MTFQIERIRKYLVGHKPPPGRPHHIFEHNSNGFLITGYEDGSDWLVSPLGRLTWGGIIRDRPTRGWAIGGDRRDYHRLHLYILDLPAKSCAEVSGLSLTRDYDIVDCDAERLVLICPPAAEPRGHTRELVIVNIASAQIADRFVLTGYTHIFHRPIGHPPDGWLMLNAYLLGETNEPPFKQGIARIHPFTREKSFELFPVEGYAEVLISPSGRHVLKANKILRPELGLSTEPRTTAGMGEGPGIYERSIEVWTGNPLHHVRTLPIDWANNSNVWKFPERHEIFWQPDEAAFWWIRQTGANQAAAICVGLDGHSSPAMRLDNFRSVCTALPGRIAELALERETTVEICRLDGSPSDDLSPRDAPAPTTVTPSAAGQKRQRNAQAALTKIVNAKSKLKFAVKTSEAADLVGAIDAITAALDRGLGWFADEEGAIKLSVKIAGTSYDEKRFFGLVEKLGSAAAPALTHLLVKCRLDADLPRVWSNPEKGQQAFGVAAKALGGIDACAWVELAEYEKCIDDFHELYFRDEVVPHFIKSHGWREESFALALADIVQMRGNLGDNFLYSWRSSGLAAAAEAAYAPEAFAELMLSIRDRMLSSPVGTFANFVARVAESPRSTYGWHNYDRLLGQIKECLTPWDVHLFAALRDRTGR
ncbi:MAG TPA: hypothetical protein VHY79_06160 [Rhizomicrobium sp.]|jgi:hypothetical protein|nr:hypothetical protein [Rhizomicrobium sp.]